MYNAFTARNIYFGFPVTHLFYPAQFPGSNTSPYSLFERPVDCILPDFQCSLCFFTLIFLFLMSLPFSFANLASRKVQIINVIHGKAQSKSKHSLNKHLCQVSCSSWV